MDVEKVQSELLDTYFDGTKIASFTRSLNRWGFNRICYSVLPKHILCYQHSMFKRARPELCTEMNLRPRGKNHNKTARIKPQPPSPAAAAADNARSSPVKSSASAPAYEASSSTLQLPQTAASTARTLPPASTPAATSSTTTDPRQTMSSGAQNPDLRTSVSLQSLLPYHVQGPIVLSLNHFDLHNLIAQVTNPRSTAASNSNTVLLEGEAIRQTHTNNNSKATSQGVGVGASKEKQQWQYLQQQQMMQQLLLTASVLNQPTSSLQQGGVRCNHDHAVRSGNDRNHNHNYNPKIYPDKSFSGSSSRNI